MVLFLGVREDSCDVSGGSRKLLDWRGGVFGILLLLIIR